MQTKKRGMPCIPLFCRKSFNSGSFTLIPFTPFATFSLCIHKLPPEPCVNPRLPYVVCSNASCGVGQVFNYRVFIKWSKAKLPHRVLLCLRPLPAPSRVGSSALPCFCGDRVRLWLYKCSLPQYNMNCYIRHTIIHL